MTHRDDHDFEEKPQEIEPKGEMPALSDDPVHQQSAEYQEHGASAYKSSSDEEIVSSSHLEPCRFRERDVSRQKHQREQRRDNDIEHLSDGFSQALRRLRYQAFWDFHRLFLKIRGKIRKKSLIFRQNNNAMEQRTVLNEAQLDILRLLSTMNSVEEVHELRQIISNYYAQKATEEMDRLWESGEWNEEKNEAILKEHLRTPYHYAN